MVGVEVERAIFQATSSQSVFKPFQAFKKGYDKLLPGVPGETYKKFSEIDKYLRILWQKINKKA